MTELRSAQWYAGDGRNAYLHRAWMRRGLPANAFSGRPHIAIANTASDLTPCNAHLDEIAASVRDGIYEAGGIPLNLPVVSLGETNVRPTAMLWRNMAAMATEEMLRANPVDGVVLLGGCDKTIPSLLMAAASVDLPAVVVPGGPMLSGTFRGVPLGCGTDVWRLSEEVRAGTLSGQEFLASESSMIRSRGHCNTMGTASTMGLLAEALGTTLPGTAGLPAPDSRLLAASHETGRLIVEMVAEGRRPSQVLTAGSFRNAIVALAAIGGSTNAVVHLLAIAGRLGVPLTVDDFDSIGSGVPLLVDLQPAGRYLMEDFHRAGGLQAVLREVADLLDPDARTVTGRPLVDYLAEAQVWDREVIRSRGRAAAAGRGHRGPSREPRPRWRHHQAGRGIGAPAHAPRARRRLRQHRGLPRPHRRPGPGRGRGLGAGPARLRPAGLPGDAGGVEPAAAAQAPRAGRTRHGPDLRRPDERDRLRHGRAARHAGGGGRRAAGPGADRRRHRARRARAAGWTSTSPPPSCRRRTASPAMTAGFASPRRGWERLYVDHVQQADTGADLDFLVGSSGANVSRDSH